MYIVKKGSQYYKLGTGWFEEKDMATKFQSELEAHKIAKLSGGKVIKL